MTDNRHPKGCRKRGIEMAIGKFVIKQIKKNPWIFKSVAAIGISYLGSRTTCHAKVSNAREVHTADLNMRAEEAQFANQYDTSPMTSNPE